MKKLNAAVIGLGFIGPQHIDALMRVPYANVCMICGHREEQTHKIAEEYGIERYCTDWREVINDPSIDVIHNCTPHALHDEINRAAILAGKHVYSEKPLSNAAASAKEIWRLAEEKGIAHGVNHQYRMSAPVQEMKARFRHGEAGSPLFYYGQYLQDSAVTATDWSPKMENTGCARVINNIGIHWLDTIVAITGIPVQAVMADLTIHHPTRTDHDEKKHNLLTEDTGMILLRFADGTPGQLIASQSAAGHKNDLRVALSCENYEMEWELETPDRMKVGYQGNHQEILYMDPHLVHPEVRPYVTTPIGHVMGWPDGLRNAVKAFYASILDGSYRRGDVPYATFRDGFMGMAFVEACVRSSQEKRWVDVEQP